MILFGFTFKSGTALQNSYRRSHSTRVSNLYGEQLRADNDIQYNVSLGFLFNNTESIRDDHYWTPRKNSLKLIELSSTNIVSLI